MLMYESWEELATKADYEGGILELIFGYGLSAEELPEQESVLAKLVLLFISLQGEFRSLSHLLPEPSYEDD